MSRCLRGVLVLAVAMSAAFARADDAYYSVRVGDLKFVEGKLPEIQSPSRSPWWGVSGMETFQAMLPKIILDGPGEAYVRFDGEITPWSTDALAPNRAFVAIRAPEGKDVTGRLLWPDEKWTKLVPLKFTIPASSALSEHREAFNRAKLAHYERLLNRDIPGAAWFRHQARETRKALKTTTEVETRQQTPWRGRRVGDLGETYDLFTGGRAMSENLQLDRALPRVAANEKPVKLDTLSGITIQEIDWKPLLKDQKPNLDPLAAKIPEDQHVVFFPSFKAALALSDETKQHDTPVLRWAEPRAEDAGVVERYQRQLCLSMSQVARLLGPHVARSVALTGSDPFFPTGTDLAVLFEAPQPALLENLLVGRISMDAVKTPDAKPVRGEVDGLAYQGFRSPDRSVSSYVARLNGAVVVTNSLYQLRRLAAVQNGVAKAIAALPEYQFFRVRYRLGDPQETALAFLSDPTIRRWCGPRWRIADSRRTRAAAVLAELEASSMDALVKKTVKPGAIYTDLPMENGGELTLTPHGVASTTYGTLDFMTPIGELSLDEVTKTEADAYERWRDGYQRNWSWAFDPIAFRLSIGKDKVAADMTVMPLIASTEYREMLSLTQGGKFDPNAGDRHSALAHAIFALNRESPSLRQAENFVSHVSKGLTLGWLGDSISVFADNDPFWEELAKVKPEDVQKFLEKELGRLPVGVRIDVSNGLKLAAFLTAARAYIEQTGPGLTHWESLKYKDHSYVRITPGREAESMARELKNLAIYYTTSGDALTITLSEKVLHGVIDRQIARKVARDAGKPAPAVGKPWLGTNAGLQVDGKILAVINALDRDRYQSEMQLHAWNNLPILNEWKRLYPDRDPVAVHKQVWGVELVCPGGGKYVWNENWQTMQSTVYGHPGEPKQGPIAPPILSTFASGNFGLTFENQGLRAQAVLDRAAPAKRSK